MPNQLIYNVDMNTKAKSKRIVYLDRAGIPTRINIPPPQHPHTWIDHSNTENQDVIERAQDSNILVVNKVSVSRQTLEACGSIEHIAVSATGFDHIDIKACQDHGVSVSNIPSYAATTVAEHVIACALTLRRELSQYREQVIQGAWQKSDAFCLFDRPINDLGGANFGIVGLGEIGLATAKMAMALGMNVSYCSRYPKSLNGAEQLSFEQLVKQSDIISVHCALTPETENMIDAHEINAMQDHAILINTARGGIVNEDAAADAITNRKLGGLAMDVLVSEPPKQNSVLISIANRSNVVITPHIAWASEQAMQSLANILSENIDAFLSGTPQNIVS